MQMEKAVFFDLDGTLADSLELMRDVYGRFMREMGAEPTDSEFSRLNGPPLREVVAILKSAHELPDTIESMYCRYVAILDDVYEDVMPVDGAVSILGQLRPLGWHVGLVTSNSAERTLRWLERNNMLASIDTVVCAEDVTVGKPDPEPYRIAMRRAGSGPQSSFAIEDSENGANAALAAGLRTILIDRSGSGMHMAAACSVVPDLATAIARLFDHAN